MPDELKGQSSVPSHDSESIDLVWPPSDRELDAITIIDLQAPSAVVVRPRPAAPPLIVRDAARPAVQLVAAGMGPGHRPADGGARERARRADAARRRSLHADLDGAWGHSCPPCHPSGPIGPAEGRCRGRARAVPDTAGGEAIDAAPDEAGGGSIRGRRSRDVDRRAARSDQPRVAPCVRAGAGHRQSPSAPRAVAVPGPARQPHEPRARDRRERTRRVRAHRLVGGGLLRRAAPRSRARLAVRARARGRPSHALGADRPGRCSLTSTGPADAGHYGPAHRRLALPEAEATGLRPAPRRTTHTR